MAATHIGLIFHGIGDPERALETGEAPYWISVEQFEMTLAMIAKARQRDQIRISFDDGNLSDHDIALPRLLEYGLTADFFPLTGRIGQAGSLGPAQIRALETAGMGIGSHGVAHLDWRRLDAGALKTELTQSRTELEAICTGQVTTAAIPFGSYNAAVLRMLRTAGYTCAYSSDRGRMNLTAFLRPRTSVRGDMNEANIAHILTSKMSLPQKARRMVGMASRRFPIRF